MKGILLTWPKNGRCVGGGSTHGAIYIYIYRCKCICIKDWTLNFPIVTGFLGGVCMVEKLDKLLH